jgi:hypothetical protein
MELSLPSCCDDRIASVSGMTLQSRCVKSTTNLSGHASYQKQKLHGPRFSHSLVCSGVVTLAKVSQVAGFCRTDLVRMLVQSRDCQFNAEIETRYMKTIRRALSKLGYLPGILAISFAFPWHGSVRTAAGKGSAPQPLWEIDLSKFGYQARPEESGEVGSRWRYRQSLVFLQENVLATTFQVHIENSGFSVRDKKLPTDPYHMVALFLDAGRGEPIKKAAWSVKTSDCTWFFPARDGQFILGLGDKLSLYSPDLSVITERTMHAAYGQFLMAMANPTADTFLVLYNGGPDFKYAFKLDLLDTTDLSTLSSWSGDQPMPGWALWGNELARFSEHDIRIETPPSEPMKVPTTIEMGCGLPTFVNRETLAVGKFGAGGCNIVALVATDGRILQEVRFHSNDFVGATRASRNGKFFAISASASRKPWKPFVVVFRLGTQKPLLILDIPPAADGTEISWGFMGDYSTEWSGLALSPDGDLLAVRAGPIVRVYRVPPEQAP